MPSDDDQSRPSDPKAKVFISYSRQDLAFANRIEETLKSRGFYPLIDRSEIYAFEDWWERIKALIGSADTIAFILSPDAVASDVCAREVAYAASLNKRFAPIVYRRVPDAAVPEPLRRLNYVFFDDEAAFSTSAERLVEALSTDIQWVRKHTEWGEQARRWGVAGRPGPDGLMLRPPVLDEAEAWLKFRPGGAPDPTEETRAFIAMSRTAFEQEEALRREQINRRLISESRRLADLAAREVAAGNCVAAIALSLEALPDETLGIARPYVPAAELTLYNACRNLREILLLKVAERTPEYDYAPQVDAQFSPDGGRVITTFLRGAAQLWDAASSDMIADLTSDAVNDGTFNPTRAAFTPDGSRIVTCCRYRDGSGAIVWNGTTGVREHAFPAAGRFHGFAPLPKELTGWVRVMRSAGERLGVSAPSPYRAIFLAERAARIIDMSNGHELVTLNGHEHNVESAAFSRDGTKVVTGSFDHTARVWNATSGKEIAVLRGHIGRVAQVHFNADGTRVLTGSRDGDDSRRECTARIWDAATGEQITIMWGHRSEIYAPQGITSASFSPDESRILTACSDGTARIWEAAGGKELLCIALQGGVSPTTACFNRDATRVLTAARDTVAIWDAADGKLLVSLKGHEALVRSAAYNADYSRVLTASADGTARIWSPDTSPLALVLHGSEKITEAEAENRDYIKDGVSVASFSPDGSRVVTRPSNGKVSSLWDSRTGERISEIADDETDLEVYEARRTWTSPDGVLMLKGTTGAVTEVATGKQIAKLKTRRGWRARNRREFELTDEMVAATGVEFTATVAAFSLDATRIVAGLSDASIHVWDVRDGRELAMFKNVGAVINLQFSRDTKRVMSTSNDRAVRLWDVASGEQIAVIDNPTNDFFGATLNSDDTHVLTAPRDGPACIWRVFPTTQALVDHAKQAIRRNLTVRERDAYFLDLEPPHWCIETGKWPYDSPEWKQWLADVRAGGRPALPKAPP